MGMIVALQYRGRSRLAFARHLRWLAGFGLLHGFNEWGHAFLPIQASYLSPDGIATLQVFHSVVLAGSFYLLLQFGMLVAFASSGRRDWQYVFPAAMLSLWFVLTVVLGLPFSDSESVDIRAPELGSEGLARVMLGLTGATLASFGMLRQAQAVTGLGSRRIVWHFRWTALCFGVYAVVAGLMSRPVESLAATWLGFSIGGEALGVIGPVLRSLAGLGVAWGSIRGLAIFEIETDRRIEEAERMWGELQRKGEARDHFLGRVISAQEAERKRVARELHDETGQSLSAVIMGVGAAAEALPRDTQKAKEILEDVREIAVHTLEGLRQMILGLRPALLDDLGLAPALRRVAEDYSKRSSVNIEVIANGLDGRLPSEVETVLFRILQEGMNNAARHSKARRAVLHLTRGESEVTAFLEDDGVGFDPAKATVHLDSGCGLGLLGMHERALLLGGAVVIDSSPGRGTRLSVRLPA